MRKFFLALVAVGLPLSGIAATAPAEARDKDRKEWNARKDRARDGRDWRQYRNYDWNRPPAKGQGYYADDYRRDSRHYKERRLSANDRIYRGRDGQYYCRRDDGTTGLIIGALGGGVLGNVVAPGGSKTLGTILGGGAGALLGREIDKGDVRCR